MYFHLFTDKHNEICNQPLTLYSYSPSTQQLRCREVGAYVSEAAGSSLISSRVKPMTSKLGFTAFMLDAQH